MSYMLDICVYFHRSVFLIGSDFGKMQSFIV